MNNKISGEEILLAIGDLPEQLLDYPTKSESRALLFKKLTVAASIIICLSAVLSVFFEMGVGSKNMDGAMGNDHASSPNGSESYDSENNTSDLGTQFDDAPHEIILSANAIIKNPYYYDNYYLIVNKYSQNNVKIQFLTYENQPYESVVCIKTADGALGNPIEMHAYNESTPPTYIIEVCGGAVISFRNNQCGKDFDIILESYGDYYLYRIDYSE